MAKYIIKNNGEILSTYRGSDKRLAVTRCLKGYNRVCLTRRDGGKQSYLVHRLVAQTFIPNPMGLPQVNHKDGNKDNNCVSNLEWVTGKQNVQHSVDTGLVKRGVNRPNAKLSVKAVRKMRGLRAEGYNYYELGKMFSVAYQTAHKVCTYQTYTHID